MSIALPLILKKIVDCFSLPNPLLIALILPLYGFIWMVSQILVHVRTMLIYKIEQRLTFSLGIKVLSHLFGLSLNYFINQQPGALTNVIRRAQQNVPHIILGLFFHILPTLIEFSFVVTLIFSLYPFVYGFLMIAIFSTFFVYTLIALKISLKAREQANEADRNADGSVADWLSNYESIKVFGRSNTNYQK